MKRKIALAALMAATLLGAAACGSGGAKKASNSLDGTGKTLTVWLQVDAQSGWKDVVDAATAAFTAKTHAAVNVEYQQWSDHLTKLDTSLQGSNGIPDVVELGNTEMPKYVFGGAFADITADKATFDNSSSWLTGLSGPATYSNKLYGVPYYAGARVLIYRTDLFQTAGIANPPTSYTDLMADAATLQAKNASDPKFSAFYMPGQYWYAAMGFVYGNGGAIATQGSDGKWTGTLESSKSEAGLQQWADLTTKYSHGDPTKNEADQDAVFAQGHSAMLYGNGWEVGAVQSQHQDPNNASSPMVDTAVKGKVAAVAMPGTGGSMPSFLGGSDLAVPAKSANKALAEEWIRDFTSNASMQTLSGKGVLPNTTSLLDAMAAAQPANAATANAAKNSWFVPMAPGWASVESGSVLQQMLVSIATGKATIDAAAKAADAQIAQQLNSAS